VTPVAASSWRDFEPAYRGLPERLGQERWAKGWDVHVGEMTNGIFAQVSKPTWLNGEPGTGGGVHLETWVGNADVKRKSLQVVLHVETSRERQRISRNDVAAGLFAHGATVVDDLVAAGYAVKPKNPAQPFGVHVPVTPASAADALVAELRRLAAIAPVVDRVLADLAGGG
jgi:hypothetical protein